MVAAMENSNNHDIITKSSSSSGAADHQTEQALDLLEESWFFENLFTKSTRMSRCYSDPCTSSNFSQDVLVKDSCTQSSKSADNGSVRCGLIRAPSLPPCLGMEGKVQERKSDGGGRSKLNRQLSLQASKTTCTEAEQMQMNEVQEKRNDRKSKISGQSSQMKLLRAPSLPTSSVGMKELIQENDSDIRMSRLILQALADSSDTFPPRPSPNKAMGQSFSMQRCRPPRNLEVETNQNTNLVQEMRRPYPNQKMLQKCRSDVAQLQGFKDLGFTYDKDDLKQDKARRPNLSEAWGVVQSRAPPIPNHVSKNSAEDMKAQLKFWARAVATNVRQEC